MSMDITIINIYSEDVLPGRHLKAGRGEAFYIMIGNNRLMLDVGMSGTKLLHNMQVLGLEAADLNAVVLSHGHKDHSGGLPAILAKHRGDSLPVYAHSLALEPKSVKIGIRVPMSFPRIPLALKSRVDFHFTRAPVEIAPGLSTTGEILERPEKSDSDTRLVHKVAGRWMWDPVMDDMSLILCTPAGLVLIAGCCHAGVLNTCARVVKLYPQPIVAIIGGLHMRQSSAEEVDHIADSLEKNFGTPILYLNHCTGDKAFARLRVHFGPEIVKDCSVGTVLHFQR